MSAQATISTFGRDSDRLKKCPYCAETIQEAAVVCRYCKRQLAVAATDLNRPIQGRMPGKITVVGYLGIGMGLLLMLTAGIGITTVGADEIGGVLLIGLIGILATVGCYLWVRR